MYLVRYYTCHNKRTIITKIPSSLIARYNLQVHRIKTHELTAPRVSRGCVGASRTDHSCHYGSRSTRRFLKVATVCANALTHVYTARIKYRFKYCFAIYAYMWLFIFGRTRSVGGRSAVLRFSIAPVSSTCAHVFRFAGELVYGEKKPVSGSTHVGRDRMHCEPVSRDLWPAIREWGTVFE